MPGTWAPMTSVYHLIITTYYKDRGKEGRTASDQEFCKAETTAPWSPFTYIMPNYYGVLVTCPSLF